MSYVLSADAGGTFLDVVLVDDRGRIGAGKALHTPEAPHVGIRTALAAAAATFGLEAEEALKQTRFVFHGTTVTTNGMVEGKGVPTGLICTRGFEDTLAIGRVKARTEGYDAEQLTHYTRLDRPDAIVPFTRIRGVAERIDQKGQVLVPLDLDEVETAARQLVENGAKAIAIAFLHSYVNPMHEEQAARHLTMMFPLIEIVTSAAIAPVIGEFERTNTAVMNAHLNPLLGQHVDTLEKALSAMGYDRDILIMQSIGGVAPSQTVKRQSVTTLLSGPVGGVIGAQRLGELMGEANIITTDMGGTSFDVGLIVDGQPQYVRQTSVEHQLLLVPAVDVEAIGAGGGSIVWLDENRNIRIGPKSAGARPGPASYGFGGTNPTITDADIILGFVDPFGIKLGDRFADRDLGAAAMKNQIADPLGISVEEAADAVLQIVNNRMADLIRKVTIQRGHDPQDFVIFSYGGSGPAHCGAYGGETGVKKIVVPPFASVFSAYGIAQSDVKHSFMRSVLGLCPQTGDVPAKLIEALNAAHASLIERASPVYDAGRVNGQQGRIDLSVDMRFAGQTTQVTVPVVDKHFDEQSIRALTGQFRSQYEQSYGMGASSRLSSFEFVNLNADVILALPGKHSPDRHELEERAPEASSVRQVYWNSKEGWQDTQVFAFDNLPFGARVAGPAIVELFRTSVPVQAGQVAYKDLLGNLILEAGEKTR